MEKDKKEYQYRKQKRKKKHIFNIPSDLLWEKKKHFNSPHKAFAELSIPKQFDRKTATDVFHWESSPKLYSLLMSPKNKKQSKKFI